MPPTWEARLTHHQVHYLVHILVCFPVRICWSTRIFNWVSASVFQYAFMESSYELSPKYRAIPSLTPSPPPPPHLPSSCMICGTACTVCVIGYQCFQSSSPPSSLHPSPSLSVDISAKHPALRRSPGSSPPFAHSGKPTATRTSPSSKSKLSVSKSKDQVVQNSKT